MAPLIATGLFKVAEQLIKRWLPDPEQAAKAQADLLTLDLQALALEAGLLQGQIDVNKEEAKHSSVFVAGWRPFCGWVCGSALAYHFILQPLLAFLLVNIGSSVVTPSFEMDSLMTVLLGLLGLGGMRSFEKSKGVTK